MNCKLAKHVVAAAVSWEGEGEGGGDAKNMALKGEPGKKKIGGVKGGSRNSLSFAVTASVITQTTYQALPECQKPAFLMFRKFRFSPGSMPQDPLFYYTKKAILPH